MLHQQMLYCIFAISTLMKLNQRILYLLKTYHEMCMRFYLLTAMEALSVDRLLL